MSYEEYLPYKMARELLPIGLFGPAPYNPHSCICGRYIVDDYCACATACIGTPKHKWAKENPEAYKAEQKEMARWKKIWKLWYEQWAAVERDIYTALESLMIDYKVIRDAESKIGCWECEQKGREYCLCDDCRGCGRKYCSGECGGEDEYEEYDEYDY